MQLPEIEMTEGGGMDRKATGYRRYLEESMSLAGRDRRSPKLLMRL